MVCEDTLKIKNFPKCLTDEEKEDFLKHFGAIHIKIITSKLKQNSVAFAKFESSHVAKSVLQRIHQIKILDSILSVQFAENDIGQPKPSIKSSETENKHKKYYKTFITKINAFNSSVSFNQPPPAYLKYEYPKPNRATINNIAHALASIPKFYTQVLHLMNKMNLPPPFSDIPDPPPRPPPIPTPISEPKETSESEIESDTEDKNKEIIPMKRKLPQKKAVKRPKFIKPVAAPTTTQSKEKCEDVFEKVDLLLQRKIEMKVSSECLENKVEPEKVDEMTDEKEEEVVEEKSEFVTDAELNANRIPLKDLNVLSVFKDYHPGIPSCRLYIKNIAKTVEKSDLEYIYGRYKKVVEGEDSVFDIRLMQEGRMKGQAFITLDSIEIAQTALKDTNGFILKDKPLVVVFGKAALAKK